MGAGVDVDRAAVVVASDEAAAGVARDPSLAGSDAADTVEGVAVTRSAAAFGAADDVTREAVPLVDVEEGPFDGPVVLVALEGLAALEARTTVAPPRLTPDVAGGADAPAATGLDAGAAEGATLVGLDVVTAGVLCVAAAGAGLDGALGAATLAVPPEFVAVELDAFEDEEEEAPTDVPPDIPELEPDGLVPSAVVGAVAIDINGARARAAARAFDTLLTLEFGEGVEVVGDGGPDGFDARVVTRVEADALETRPIEDELEPLEPVGRIDIGTNPLVLKGETLRRETQ